MGIPEGKRPYLTVYLKLSNIKDSMTLLTINMIIIPSPVLLGIVQRSIRQNIPIG